MFSSSSQSIYDSFRQPKFKQKRTYRKPKHQYTFANNQENHRIVSNIPYNWDFKATRLQNQIFYSSLVIYALFRKGQIQTKGGIMNHVLFGFLSYTASCGYSNYFYKNPYIVAALKNNQAEAQFKKKTQLKQYAKSLNPNIRYFLAAEGLSYLTEDQILNDKQVSDFVYLYPEALKKREQMLSSKKGEESGGEQQDEGGDQEED